MKLTRCESVLWDTDFVIIRMGVKKWSLYVLTESHFGRTLALWKACEKHHLTTAQMFHISEIIRSYANPDLIISAYENEIENLPVINGVPRKITLCSNGICYGPCPEPDEERIQKVTISATGKVYITLKNYEGVTLRKIQKRIPVEKAAGWLGDVARDKCMEEWHTQIPSVDSGTLNQLYTFIATGSVSLIQLWIQNGMTDAPETLATLLNRISQGVLQSVSDGIGI